MCLFHWITIHLFICSFLFTIKKLSFFMCVCVGARFILAISLSPTPPQAEDLILIAWILQDWTLIIITMIDSDTILRFGFKSNLIPKASFMRQGCLLLLYNILAGSLVNVESTTNELISNLSSTCVPLRYLLINFLFFLIFGISTWKPWIHSLYASYGIEKAKVGSLIQNLAILMCLFVNRCCFVF